MNYSYCVLYSHSISQTMFVNFIEYKQASIKQALRMYCDDTL